MNTKISTETVATGEWDTWCERRPKVKASNHYYRSPITILAIVDDFHIFSRLEPHVKVARL
jgi:hypothetical protein